MRVSHRVLAFILFFTPLCSCDKEHLSPLETLEEDITSEEAPPKYTLKKLFRLSSFGVTPFTRNSQGMDIFNDRYLFQTGIDDTKVHILDLETQESVGYVEFTVPDGETAHMNNINCGRKSYRSDKYPLLYISQTGASHSCFVIRISDDAKSYELIQTIKYTGKKHHLKSSSYDWFIDLDHDLIYTYGHYNGNREKREIVKFRLPSLDDTEVIYTDDDVLDSFVLENQSIYQGSKMINGFLYAPVGAGNALYPSCLMIIDLDKKEVHESVPLTCGEPEAIGIYKSGAIINTGSWDPHYYFIYL